MTARRRKWWFTFRQFPRKIWEIHLIMYRNFFSALLQVHFHFLHVIKQPDCSQSNFPPLFLNNFSWFVTPFFQICFLGSGNIFYLRSVYNTKHTLFLQSKPDSFLTLFKTILIFFGRLRPITLIPEDKALWSNRLYSFTYDILSNKIKYCMTIWKCNDNMSDKEKVIIH